MPNNAQASPLVPVLVAKRYSERLFIILIGTGHRPARHPKNHAGFCNREIDAAQGMNKNASMSLSPI
jgi:hypothetical protein